MKTSETVDPLEAERGRRAYAFFTRMLYVLKEEKVILAYLKLLGITKFPRPFGSDGVHDSALFMFPYDVQLRNSTVVAKCLVQACYYLRRFAQEDVDKGIVCNVPLRVAVCSRHEALVVPVALLEPFFLSDDYGWGRAVAFPDPVLVRRLILHMHTKYTVHPMSFPSGIHDFLEDLETMGVNQAAPETPTVSLFAFLQQDKAD